MRRQPASAEVGNLAQIVHSVWASPRNVELPAYGPRRAVRVQLAQGRVTQTVLPALASDGPVSFAAAPAR